MSCTNFLANALSVCSARIVAEGDWDMETPMAGLALAAEPVGIDENVDKSAGGSDIAGPMRPEFWAPMSLGAKT